VIPALFDEANKLRRLTVEVMARLDASGIDCFLPDLPGCNDSLAPLHAQTLGGWRDGVRVAASHFQATHVLALRGGALLDPGTLPGWRFAKVNGRSLLRTMLRAQAIADKEMGRETGIDALAETARREGIELAGWLLGAELFRELEAAEPTSETRLADVALADVGGPGLWLRAEPDEDADQADALAAIIAIGMTAR
jgi:hypothetical protein